MDTMRDALRRSGLAAPAPAPAKKSAPKPVMVEPCSDHIGRRIALLLRVMKRSTLVERVTRESEAPYGFDRRLEALNGPITRAIGQLPRKVGRELEASDILWSAYRRSDLDDEMSCVIEALALGGYDAWVAHEARAQAAADGSDRWPLPPPVGEMSAEELSNSWAQADAYRARLVAWEDDLTADALRRMGYPGDDSLVRTYQKAITAEADRRREEEEARERCEAEAWLATAGPAASRSEFLRRVESAPYSTADTYAASMLGWRHMQRPRGSTPPQGWEALPGDALWRVSEMHVAAADELRRRAGCETAQWAVGIDRAGKPAVLAPGESPGYCTPWTDLRPVALTPHPEGWVVRHETPRRKWGTWAPPEAYEALERLRAADRGTLDVSRLAIHWGRHETKRFGRCALKAHNHWKTIGAAESLWRRLDDLELLRRHDPTVVPEDAWHIDATLRLTARGAYLDARPGRRGAIMVLRGSTQSHGRHGVFGTLHVPKAGQQAVALAWSGGSWGGGQRATCVVAQVTAADPLLLESGVGYTYDPRRGLWEVPGLATGHPGTPLAYPRDWDR